MGRHLELPGEALGNRRVTLVIMKLHTFSHQVTTLQCTINSLRTGSVPRTLGHQCTAMMPSKICKCRWSTVCS